METIQIRLNKHEIEEIDNAVTNGRYASRSEAIRMKLRELDTILETIEVMRDKDVVESIKRGLKDFEEGRTIPFDELKKKYGVN